MMATVLRVRASQGTLRRAFILQFTAYPAGASFAFAWVRSETTGGITALQL